MRLKNYHIGGSFILVELKEYKTSPGGVIQVNPSSDKIMKVLKVGGSVNYQVADPSVEGGMRKIRPGDFIMAGANPMMQLEFDPYQEQTEKIIALQTNEFNIMSCYTPDEDETRYFTITKGGAQENLSRDLNVIDNPGIEKGTYLKEEEEAVSGKLFLNKD